MESDRSVSTNSAVRASGVARIQSRLDTTAFERNNLLKANPSLQGLHMRNALALTVCAALAAIAVFLPQPAQARDRWPVVPDEVGVRQIGRVGWLPYRCSDGPVFNFYHGAYYNAPPAVYLGYAYRPYYRYAAWRVIPRTYSCVER